VKISAVIPTKGDVDLQPILSGLPADEVIVVNAPGRGLYARYEAIEQAKHDVIYTQDDDCLVDASAVVAEYEPGAVTCNMPSWKRPEYPDGIALVGWGAVFHRNMVKVFGRYLSRFPADDLFLREADRVFTKLNRCKLIDVPFSHLPHAHAADRLGANGGNLNYLTRIRVRLNQC
jgi:hypothetical protein